MAPPVEINYIAVFVSAAVSVVLGMVWYGPLFGKTWMRLAGINEAAMKKKSMLTSFSGMIVVSLLTSYILAHFVDYAQAVTFVEGMTAGFWIWLGFMATIQVGAVLWDNKPWKLFIVNTAYSLVQMLLIGGILAVWA